VKKAVVKKAAAQNGAYRAMHHRDQASPALALRFQAM
jgi:hypothetical protein